MLRDLILIALLVVALRAPFLTQPVQGDDIYYLEGAQHAQIDPAHPHHAKYLFQGRLVDMRGHPHPPLNAWILGGLLAAVGEVKELPFHAAYALFSLMAAGAMYALTRLYTARALEATCLFCAVPAFVVNGNSLESDLPLLAFWMVGMAAFFWAAEEKSAGLLALAAVGLAGAGLAAYQSVLAAPILALLLWRKQRRWWVGYAVALTPVLVIALYQAWEAMAGKEAPVAVTLGYFREYGLQQLTAKLKNAGALTGHLGWMVFPALAVAAFWSWWALAGLALAFVDPNPLYWVGAIGAVAYLRRGSAAFGWWPHVFFVGALGLFFAGSARYLLPMAAPLAIAIVMATPQRGRVWAGVGLQVALGLALSWTNYQHWAGYRDFVTAHAGEIRAKRTWVNGEWGLRHYAENLGALALAQGQAVRAGDLVLTSELGYPIPFTVGGGQLVQLAKREIRPLLPLRLIGLGAKSGYSTASAGLRPFDATDGAVDRVRLEQVVEREPTRSYLQMGAAESDQHIVSGAYQIEDGQYRWIGREAKFLLKASREEMDAAATVYIPELAPARVIALTVNGRVVAEQRLEKPGLYVVEAKGVKTGGGRVLMTVRCDRTFQASGDTRELGVILREAGLR